MFAQFLLTLVLLTVTPNLQTSKLLMRVKAAKAKNPKRR